jgi:tetratricopeptide (TPR) repeat protein
VTEEGLNPDLMKLSLPGKNWAMEFNLRDFQVEDMSILPDYKGRKIMAKNDKTNLILSVFFTPAQKKVSHKEFRDNAWERLERLPFKREGVKKYEVGQWAILEYVVKDVKGIKDVNHKSVFAYRVQDDTWIDFHLSKVLYTAVDEGLFKEFIASAKVLDHFTPSSIDHFGYGSYFYLNKDYEKAIVYYEKALDQEKQAPRLQKKFWIVLVDNLGMAYGLTGNLKMAERIFQYGIDKDPTYPLFYYSLACTYAEANDLDRALLNLAKAGEYKSNMIPGEKWPELATDPSFERFRENKRFIEAANKFLR